MRLKQLVFIGLFFLVSGLAAQVPRDTLIVINGDSGCYVKLPVQRMIFHQEVIPVVHCPKLNIATVHVGLYNRYGVLIHESYQANEDWSAILNKLPANYTDLLWVVRIEEEDVSHTIQAHTFTASFYLAH